ncbi:MAG TPA: hypothetical protein VGS99_09390 [Gammaproteobacteria bacterium]|nr:hypothetical protein [Gammaproteobacteria bacterium]
MRKSSWVIWCLAYILCAMFLPAACTRPDAAASLDEILSRNHAAVARGADSSGIRSMEVDLAMLDGGRPIDAVYRVTRDGRMRIDILKQGKRVYTEAYDGKQGWDWGRDESAPFPDTHGAALWHGTQFPGQIFELKDMAALGHRLEYLGRETLDGVNYYVLKLTLSDGFETYRYINPDTWLIERGRDFRAFHPAVDPKQTWVETRWADYRPVEGVLRSFSSVNRDVTTGELLASQTVTAFKINPEIDPQIFAMPQPAAR